MVSILTLHRSQSQLFQSNVGRQRTATASGVLTMTIDTTSTQDGFKVQIPWRIVLRRGRLAWHIWSGKRRTRRSLLDLTDDQLRDIGISRSEAQREVRKSFYWN
jgi:uncharacterized protein YjiS (DUF1127 family)